MKEHFTKQKSLEDKGFSLVEIVVIIAIMIVLLAILTPSILRYVENSRMQKDESAMDEVCHGVLLALSDSEIFDEAVSYAIPNNYVTYTDSSGVYAAKYIDEEFWAPDGSGNAVTITFNPDENGTYTLADGLVNDMTYGNGSVADTRTAEGLKQCYFSEMGQQKLYHKVAQTIGETFSEKSATYKNSSYTVFITFDVVNGIKRADVYGEWNGTNLDESCPASLGSGTNSYTEEEEPEQTKTGGTTQSNFTSSDLQGSGGASGAPAPSYKKAPCGIEGHNLSDGKNHEMLNCGHYGCQCSGEKVPEGGVYYVGVTNRETADWDEEYTSYTAKYGPGECLPAECTTGDIFRYDEYEYRYNQSNSHPSNSDSCSWSTKSGQNGWGVRVIYMGYKQHQFHPILAEVNNQPVTSMQNTYYKCNLRKAPVIPSSVTNMISTFERCSSLTDITNLVIPENVTNMGLTFSRCTTLTDASSLIIPSQVTNMSNTFSGCTKLQKAPVLTRATKLTSLSATFSGCTTLRREGLPVLPDHITAMSGTFAECTSLTDISDYHLPNSLTDMSGTFRKCSALTSEGIPVIPSEVKKMSSTFSDCISLTTLRKLIIPQGVTDISYLVSGCTALRDNDLPVIPNSVTKMESTFNGCTSLVNVSALNIPTSVTDMSRCFGSCTNLVTATTIPSTAHDIDYLFYGCTSLVDVSDIIVLHLQNMNYTFYGCTSLTGVVKVTTPYNHGPSISRCFAGTVKPITLTGTTSNRLQNLANTATNGNVTY